MSLLTFLKNFVYNEKTEKHINNFVSWCGDDIPVKNLYHLSQKHANSFNVQTYAIALICMKYHSAHFIVGCAAGFSALGLGKKTFNFALEKLKGTSVKDLIDTYVLPFFQQENNEKEKPKETKSYLELIHSLLDQYKVPFEMRASVIIGLVLGYQFLPNLLYVKTYVTLALGFIYGDHILQVIRRGEQNEVKQTNQYE